MSQSSDPPAAEVQRDPVLLEILTTLQGLSNRVVVLETPVSKVDTAQREASGGSHDAKQDPANDLAKDKAADTGSRVQGETFASQQFV